MTRMQAKLLLGLGGLVSIKVFDLGGRRCFVLLLASKQSATEDRVFDSDHPPAIVVKKR